MLGVINYSAKFFSQVINVAAEANRSSTDRPFAADVDKNWPTRLEVHVVLQVSHPPQTVVLGIEVVQSLLDPLFFHRRYLDGSENEKPIGVRHEGLFMAVELAGVTKKPKRNSDQTKKSDRDENSHSRVDLDGSSGDS